mmetsp:Transcript_16570/g.39327  ORF Transcript_16570/g.39327 Transcript_16570/m.39327 type:complete len:221 (-) Transcript_16570:106-768(-)
MQSPLRARRGRRDPGCSPRRSKVHLVCHSVVGAGLFVVAVTVVLALRVGLRGLALHSSFALCAAGKIQDPLQPLVIKEEVEGPNIALLAKRVRLEVAVVCVQVALLQLDGLIDGCPEALEKGAVAETRCLLPDLEESKTCPRDRRGKGKEHGISNEAVTHASTESKQTFPIPDESAGVSPCARISIRTRETSSSWLSMLSSTSLRVRSLRKWWARSWLKS